MQCVEVEPNRGELWNRVAKSPKNAHDKVEVLLKKVRLRVCGGGGWGMVMVRAEQKGWRAQIKLLLVCTQGSGGV